ncbi:unnamed protein product [Polarella glacialis]|uniref:Protein root UVB sensitive/RUS domain-containing protein n=1 Tax=Polarella glacialis TaxID=89957 RepID=A0A813GHH7_POLGL|nr:unnamed protein product [Polarella glacialis]
MAPKKPSGKTEEPVSSGSSSWVGLKVSEFDETRPSSAKALLLYGSKAQGTFVQDSRPRGSGAGSAANDYLDSLKASLAGAFLPVGYPHSVSKEYFSYQAWDTVQAMCSYLRGVLATQALLRGVGVGKEGATALAATIIWVLKDGSGMVGGLGFATFCSVGFDVNVKTWRLFADVANNVGLTLDLLAPMAGDYFLLVICVANVANESPATVWTAFVLLTLLHTFANYTGVRSLLLPTLSPSRLWLLCCAWVDSKQASSPSADSRMTIEHVASLEPLLSLALPGSRGLAAAGPVRVGVRWADAFGGEDAEQFDRSWKVLGGVEQYLLARKKGAGTPEVVAVLLSGADEKVEIRAFLHAALAHRRLCSVPGSSSWLEESYAELSGRGGIDDFTASVAKLGWDLQRGVLGARRFRCRVES